MIVLLFLNKNICKPYNKERLYQNRKSRIACHHPILVTIYPAVLQSFKTSYITYVEMGKFNKILTKKQ